MTGHNQWAKRPPDERIPDLKTLFDRTEAQYKASKEAEYPFGELRAEASKNDLFITRVGGKLPAKLTNWAFGQIAARVGAPASYLATLPATLAAQNLNHGIFKRAQDKTVSAIAKMLLQRGNENPLLRAVTTDKYERIWNYEVSQRLLDLEAQGWEPAMPDFNSSGPDDFPALYMGDRDIFAFIRLKNVYFEQPIKTSSYVSQNYPPIYKGVIYENSEVGSKKIRVTKFFYNSMCGNHIIWGASDVLEFEARHVGNVRDKVKVFAARVAEYGKEGMDEDVAVIKRATHKIIASTKEELLDELFDKRWLGVSRKDLEAGYDAVKPEQDGKPESVWGMVQGLTRHSQTKPYADERTELDRAAGKVAGPYERILSRCLAQALPVQAGRVLWRVSTMNHNLHRPENRAPVAALESITGAIC